MSSATWHATQALWYCYLARLYIQCTMMIFHECRSTVLRMWTRAWTCWLSIVVWVYADHQLVELLQWEWAPSNRLSLSLSTEEMLVFPAPAPAPLPSAFCFAILILILILFCCISLLLSLVSAIFLQRLSIDSTQQPFPAVLVCSVCPVCSQCPSALTLLRASLSFCFAPSRAKFLAVGRCFFAFSLFHAFSCF